MSSKLQLPVFQQLEQTSGKCNVCLAGLPKAACIFLNLVWLFVAPPTLPSHPFIGICAREDSATMQRESKTVLTRCHHTCNPLFISSSLITDGLYLCSDLGLEAYNLEACALESHHTDRGCNAL